MVVAVDSSTITDTSTISRAARNSLAKRLQPYSCGVMKSEVRMTAPGSTLTTVASRIGLISM